MLALHTEVLLYKSWGIPGFSLLSPDFHHLEENLNYVELHKVTFDLWPDKIVPGRKTVHAVARGTLVSALPNGINPHKGKDKFLNTLTEIDYNPNSQLPFFFYVKTQKEVRPAEYLYAYNNRVWVKHYT